MPKFNRIRIINFSYNNDNREIQDETYKFYDGENALLNLSNGGGKSVLIQLMIQPIIPDFKIQKRPMSDYFKKNSSPAFIMVEWLLDNEARKDYLLTGIVIAPKGNGNEESNKINYYTFMSHYDKASSFDISSVPFTKKEDGRIIILPFERSREAVRSLSSKQREVYYFSKDDASEYRKQLMNFGINQEEWKNIIARMNNDEGGIDELFERCSTSNSVFNEWILKTVEKAMLSGQSKDVQIYELLDGLATETLKNESHIKDQQLMESYFKVHQQLEENLQETSNKLEEYIWQKSMLVGMHEGLIRQNRRSALELEEIKIEIKDYEDERHKINQEESSDKYYEEQEKHENCIEIYLEAEQQLKGYEEQRKKNLYSQKLLRAAKLNKNIEKLKADIDALKRQQEHYGNDNENFIHLVNLKYSLKISFSEQIKLLEAVKIELEEKKTANQLEVNSTEQNIHNLNEENKAIIQSLGGIKERITAFEKYEQQKFLELRISLIRNVLKEFEQKEIDGTVKQFQKDEDRVKEMIFQLSKERDELQPRLEGLNSEKIENALRKAQAVNELARKEEELNIFKEQESICNGYLEKYAIELALLYQQDRLSSRLRDKEVGLNHRKNSWELEKNQIEQMINGINQNHVYIPEVLLKALEEADVDYTSGEAYLSNLSEQKRQQMLAENPLLPFSIIIKAGDKAKIGKIQFDNLFLRQAVPVLTYEQLKDAFSENNRMLYVDDRLSMISAYERKIFLDTEKAAYLEELRHQYDTLEESIGHTDEELTNVLSARHVLEAFHYHQGFEAELIAATQKFIRTKNECEELESKLNRQIVELSGRRSVIESSLENARKELINAERRNECFKEFLEKNKEYMADYTRFLELDKQKTEKDKLYQQLQTKQKELLSELKELEIKLYQLSAELNDVKKRSVIFAEAKEAVKISGSLDYLYQQYETLSKEIEGSIKLIEENINDKQKSYTEAASDLDRLELPFKEYEKLSYDLEDESRLIIEEGIIEKQIEHQKGVEGKARTKRDRALFEFEAADKKLRETGLIEPLNKASIRQDYENRRKKLRFELDRLGERSSKIKERTGLYTLISDRIENMISIQGIVPAANFQLEENADAQFNRLKKQYIAAKEGYEEMVKNYKKLYDKAKADYGTKHQCITDILDSLKTLELVDNDISYDKLYFHVEEFVKKKENLKKLLDFYDVQLKNIVNTKRQITDQCVSYATMIYEDIKRITAKSKIRLTGKSRPVQMLKIDIPESLDSRVNDRMTDYVENSLRVMVEMSRLDADKNNRKYKDKMRDLMSSRELLNQLIGTVKIQVSVYKIDLNPNNSGMKKWEDAMAQNSGGEKFVVFFTLVSTLISYTREAAGRNAGTDMSKDSKVILMDNPFARTSSEHLLKAVIDIARTFNIQLICLSDLSQSSITNRFALIYQLAVRKMLYSDKEILKTGNVQINKEGLYENEKLEHIAVYERYEQESLFDL